jgi:ribA/ribD-fused uncharacterized protein
MPKNPAKSPKAEAAISSFTGNYRFLSNFWISKVSYDGEVWKSSEHAYQAAKTNDPNEKRLIRAAETAGETKYLGKTVTLRKDWESVKLGIMLDILRCKFTDPFLKQELLSTNNAELIEGNSWGDTYWGVCNGRGKNHLGKLLMAVREEIRNG